MNRPTRILSALALGLAVLPSFAANTQTCSDHACWQALAQRSQAEVSRTGKSLQAVQDAAARLNSLQSKRADRLLNLAQMQLGLDEVQSLINREFKGNAPTKEVIARLTREQLALVQKLTPVPAATPERTARDARIRELTEALRGYQERDSKRYKAAMQSGGSDKAVNELVDSMRSDFERANQELLRLQADKRRDAEAAAAQAPDLQDAKARLGNLIRVGEFADRKALMAATVKALQDDDSQIAQAQAELDAAVKAMRTSSR